MKLTVGNQDGGHRHLVFALYICALRLSLKCREVHLILGFGTTKFFYHFFFKTQDERNQNNDHIQHEFYLVFCIQNFCIVCQETHLSGEIDVW